MFTNSSVKSTEDLSKNDFRRNMPRFQAEHIGTNQQLVAKMTKLADKKGVALSQFVLAWVLAQGPEFIVIPGTKRTTYLEQNFKAGEVVLSPEEITEMTVLLDNFQVSGGSMK